MIVYVVLECYSNEFIGVYRTRKQAELTIQDNAAESSWKIKEIEMLG